MAKRISISAIEFDKQIIELTMAENAEDNTAMINRMKRITAKIIKDDLTVRQKQIIVLYYYKEMGVSEIADKLELSASTVSRTLKRGRDNIYKRLKYYFL